MSFKTEYLALTFNYKILKIEVGSIGTEHDLPQCAFNSVMTF